MEAVIPTRSYSPFIDPYIDLILNNKVEHCREQEQLILNNVIPVLNRGDVIIDDKRIEDGLKLQKYFPYKLLPWEVFLFALMVGIFTDTGDIYFHVIRIIVGRGTGKNGFIEFLAFYFLSELHGITGYNVDLIANGELQARTSIDALYNLITEERDPIKARSINSNYRATKEQIFGTKTNSVFRLNTSSKKGKDSKRTGCVIYDEKHEYTDATNMNTLKSGLGKRPWWREITITTNGHVRGGVLDKELELNKDILKEYNPDNRTLVFWCHIENENEWNDINKLVKAIPSLPYSSFDSLRTVIKQEIIDMPNTPDYFPEYMAKRCNYPISDPETAVAEWSDIVACCQSYDMSTLDGKACVGGIDYSKTNDFVGCALVFHIDDKYIVLHHSFICRKSADLPYIKAPLNDWVDQGLCEYVDDVEIPAELVADWFGSMASKYNIIMIAIDNFRYSILNRALKQYGFDAFDKQNKNIWLVRPSDIIRTSPIINSCFIKQLFCFVKDRMMCWYTNNAKALNSNGNITYGKIDPRIRKTDGFMALVAAMTIIDKLPDDFIIPDAVNLGTYTY